MRWLIVAKLILTTVLLSSVVSARPDEIVYQRSFKLPVIVGTQRTFHYSNGPLAVRPTTGNLVIRGHANFNDCAEVVPPTTDGATATLSGGWFNPTYGIDASEKVRTGAWYYIRGLTITDEDYVRVCLGRWYNVTNSNEFPFLTGDLAQAKSYGPWNGGQHSLRLGGYITRLSPELQAAFSVRYCGGETIAQGVSTSHEGPSMSFFDFPPNNLAPFGAFTSTYVTGFDDPNPYPGWFPSHQISSIHSLPNSVIWVGRRGFTNLTDVQPKPGGGAVPWHTPQAYYGPGTQTFTKTDGSTITVVDETSPNAQGYHSDEYECRVIMLANARIKAGGIVAADYTELKLPECNGRNKTFSAAYDSQKALLYVLDAQAGGTDQPWVRVYKVQ